ncbi:MAG TPA: hypothetical protein VFF81_12475 [Noviherbaspirillum sp.]|nr:hypothetical protein [Noviherbaspirillum sp.]
MKYSLSILVSALVLAGCITNPSNKQSAAEPTATTAPAASTTQAAPAGTAAAPASTGADAPCTPAASAKASTTGKTKSAKKTSTSKSKSAAAPCAPAANSTNAAADNKDQSASSANANRKEVKGINDWTGYVQGTPARNSKFAKLKIGMGEKEVIDLIGAPTDQSMHMTGKAWIPFYVGSGKREVWFHYKGVGRLLFADNAGFTTDTGLIGIEHDASERGYK